MSRCGDGVCDMCGDDKAVFWWFHHVGTFTEEWRGFTRDFLDRPSRIPPGDLMLTPPSGERALSPEAPAKSSIFEIILG